MLQRLASEAGTGSGRVLDLACGVGFHAHRMAEAGFQVTGIDLAPSMLAVARSNAPESAPVSFREADMRTPQPGEYDFAYCLGNSIAVLPDLADFFHANAGNLVRDGMLLLHTIDFATLRSEGKRHAVKEAKVDGCRTAVTKLMLPVESGALVSITVLQEKNAAWETDTDMARIHEHSDADLAATARQAGFIEEARFGSLAGEPCVPGKTPDRVFLLRRK